MDYQIATAWLLVNFRGTSRNLADTRRWRRQSTYCLFYGTRCWASNTLCRFWRYTAVISTRMTDFI